jgi:hypothetical protein
MAVRLKSRTECPPGGFLVTIAPLKQKEPKQFWSFREAVNWFQEIAIANPRFGLATDPVAIGNFIDQQNALRVLGIRGADVYVVQKGGPGHFMETKKGASLLKPLVAVGDKIRQLSAGAVLLEEWHGEGFPTVLADEANRRAAICASCPQNGLGDLTRWFTVFASEKIRRQIEVAQKLELKTTSDDKLGICEACLCPLKLKVHVPLDLIKKHLTPKSLAALDPRCWILK